eukprot:CAMPEP_0172368998 /NCGR_PEP_ID=MMETSP1060-20121228/30106_1 /TAXON_ID=37318 /ORGANISM="Pseudo-nitzschia pungens, Strain cf. cingulata" /LENGTH=311 /DNA_ID=CAMNT_0013093765 /DNA_START=185 /DNA_END=1120 /DNA_ORIENTATION=+
MVLSNLFQALNTGIVVEGNAEECIATASHSTSAIVTATQQPEENHERLECLDTNRNPYAKSTTVEGVELPGVLKVDGIDLYRNGHGMRFIPFLGMNIKIYVAAMYSAKPILSAVQAMREDFQNNNNNDNHSDNHSESIFDATLASNNNINANANANSNSNTVDGGPLQLDFTFLRYVGRSRVVSAWTQQLDHSVTYRDYDGYEADKDLFIALASEGPIENMGTQSVQLVGDETRVIDQGIFKGSIVGRNFQRSFLSMWFGSMAVSEDLKSNLLRGDEHHPSAVGRVRQRLREQLERDPATAATNQVSLVAV